MGALLVSADLFQIVHILTGNKNAGAEGRACMSIKWSNYSAALALWLVLMLVCFSESLSLFTFASAWRTPAP